MAQWLRLSVSTTGGTGSIRAPGTKILHATWHGQTKKKFIEFTYFNLCQDKIYQLALQMFHL